MRPTLTVASIAAALATLGTSAALITACGDSKPPASPVDGTPVPAASGQASCSGNATCGASAHKNAPAGHSNCGAAAHCGADAHGGGKDAG